MSLTQASQGDFEFDILGVWPRDMNMGQRFRLSMCAATIDSYVILTGLNNDIFGRIFTTQSSHSGPTSSPYPPFVSGTIKLSSGNTLLLPMAPFIDFTPHWLCLNLSAPHILLLPVPCSALTST